jgi:hypothetical protein
MVKMGRLRTSQAPLCQGYAWRHPAIFFVALKSCEALAEQDGAGDGNRTRIASLEGWSSTIELHPRLPATSNISVIVINYY